ncbi:MAG: redox-regulated ATPase YchF [Candidatus Omnitrophica bacterium]|nr:redox-regulated ATPase YchF [Candidatus Omnitrophota bacterium]
MEIGIVGLPNVGKSTLFNALTGAGVAAENFPFTTIEPNIGIVPLADERLMHLAKEFQSAKITPSGIRFVDIAGIVKGASQGEGLGNKFLGNIRSVDAICHVVRCFHDENIVNATGDLNPIHAAETIETELLLADLQQAEKAYQRLIKVAKSGDQNAKDKVEALDIAIKGFNDGQSARSLNLPDDVIGEFQFLTMKPILYVANTSEGDPCDDMLKPLRELAEKEKTQVIVLSTKLEAEILELPQEERESYYEDAGITSPGLAKLAKAGQELLDLICFFTAGEKESRAWLVSEGTKAPQAAGKIHTDIERGFIRAEIFKYDDLKREGNYETVKQKNLVTLEGKEYVMKDGDVAHFRFSV